MLSDDWRRRALGEMGIQSWILREEWAERLDAPATPKSANCPHTDAQPRRTLERDSHLGPRQPAETPVAELGWDELAERVAFCQACALHKTRTHAVFGVGDRQAQWMVIGEAPGADEDRQGEPFVGRAGQLLNAMLHAAGFRREQVYIANILKCRPPGNRDPRPEEVVRCEPYLHRQIALVAPQIILAVGRIAAQNLLKTDANLGSLRGRIHYFGDQQVPVVVTYHPAYLLRSPLQKRKAWEDLRLALKVGTTGAKPLPR